jgi:acetyl esterase/lipase
MRQSVWGRRPLVALGLACWAWVVAAAPPLSAELFFRLPEIGEAHLSPSGSWLALAVPATQQRRGLAVLDLEGHSPPRLVAGFADIDVGAFHWVGNELLVFSLFDRERGSGDQRHGPGLFVVQRDGSGLRQLVNLGSGRTPWPRRVLDGHHGLLHIPAVQVPGDETVIMGEYRFDQRGDPDSVWPKRLALRTGRVGEVANQPRASVLGWMFDSAGEPRVAVMAPDAGQRAVALRGSDGWRTLKLPDADGRGWRPHSLDAQGRLLVLDRAGPRGEAVLKRFDEARGAPVAAALVDVPGFDFEGGLVHDPEGGEPLGVRVHRDAETAVWFDAGMAAVQKAVDERLPGRINRLECRRCRTPERLVLVTSYSDRHPGEFWIWRGEAAAPTMWRPVGRRRPAIDPARMGELDFHRFRARDGLEVPVWVTSPAGTPPGRALPTVVLVHGGPWVRGTYWEWEGLAQFLASRGYRVLEPEFRGSTGYGWAHHEAGWRQWGRAMQDDLADAVDWAVAQKLTDRPRVCIAGASYGGYAALMGVVRHPELFRCAAAWVAVTEPRLLFEHRYDSDTTDEIREITLPRRLADPDRDAKLLREISPVVQAARIRAPLLLAWGEEDRRVPLVHGRRLQQALREAGHSTHEVAVYPGEGHAWLRIETHVDFAARLERFLARELLTPSVDSR